MPDITIRDARLHYEETGTGPETILFIHGLMLASESWHAQRDHFAATHRVITFDLRGQGHCEHARSGLGLDSLADDTAELISKLAPDGCHVVGFSMGAFIALRVGARYPGLVRSLTVIGPSADAESWAKLPAYAAMIALVTLAGVRPVAPRLMQILFGRSVLANPDDASLVARWRAVVDALPRSLVRAAAASAIRGSIHTELGGIAAPTLVVAGEEDYPVPLHHQRAVAAAIAGAQFEQVPAAGHAVMLERPEWFNARLAHFLAGKPAPNQA